MPSINKKTVLVTGASSGIGKATVKRLLQENAVVYAAARRVEKMKDLQDAGAQVISLDVTKENSITSAVQEILSKHQAIDILINNAGYGSYGAMEDVPLDEAKRQFDVNIFGLARITQLALPEMRKKGYGKIVNISSMGGKVYTPFGGWYHATKHALEGLTDCLRVEVADFGIDCVLVEPGGIKTDWGTIAAENLEKSSGNSPYAAKAEKTAAGMKKLYTSNRLSDPDVIAKVIVKAVTAGRPKTRYVAGYGARLAISLRRIFGDRLFDKMLSLMY